MNKNTGTLSYFRLQNKTEEFVKLEYSGGTVRETFLGIFVQTVLMQNAEISHSHWIFSLFCLEINF